MVVESRAAITKDEKIGGAKMTKKNARERSRAIKGNGSPSNSPENPARGRGAPPLRDHEFWGAAEGEGDSRERGGYHR